MGSLLSQQKSSEAQLMFTYSMNEFIQFNFICMAPNANNSCDNRKKTTRNYQTLGLPNTRFRTVTDASCEDTGTAVYLKESELNVFSFLNFTLIFYACLFGVFLAFLFNFLFFTPV